MSGLFDDISLNPFLFNKPGLLSYPVRQPYPGEADYFAKNPRVAGMAAEDNAVTLNPGLLNPAARQSVAANEMLRLFMRQHGLQAPMPTPEQRKGFVGTPYEQNLQALGDSIIARALSGDPSAGDLSEEQRKFAAWVQSLLKPKGW